MAIRSTVLTGKHVKIQAVVLYGL